MNPHLYYSRLRLLSVSDMNRLNEPDCCETLLFRIIIKCGFRPLSAGKLLDEKMPRELKNSGKIVANEVSHCLIRRQLHFRKVNGVVGHGDVIESNRPVAQTSV